MPACCGEQLFVVRVSEGWAGVLLVVVSADTDGPMEAQLVRHLSVYKLPGF